MSFLVKFKSETQYLTYTAKLQLIIHYKVVCLAKLIIFMQKFPQIAIFFRNRKLYTMQHDIMENFRFPSRPDFGIFFSYNQLTMLNQQFAYEL